MNIKKARQILGKDFRKLTDNEVLNLIKNLEILANMAIDNFLALSPEERAKYSKTVK